MKQNKSAIDLHTLVIVVVVSRISRVEKQIEYGQRTHYTQGTWPVVACAWVDLAVSACEYVRVCVCVRRTNVLFAHLRADGKQSTMKGIRDMAAAGEIPYTYNAMHNGHIARTTQRKNK